MSKLDWEDLRLSVIETEETIKLVKSKYLMEKYPIFVGVEHVSAIISLIIMIIYTVLVIYGVIELNPFIFQFTIIIMVWITYIIYVRLKYENMKRLETKIRTLGLKLEKTLADPSQMTNENYDKLIKNNDSIFMQIS